MASVRIRRFTIYFLTSLALWNLISCKATEVPSAFRQWLYSQRIPVPVAELNPGSRILGGLASIVLSGGNCSHLMVRSVSTLPVEDRPEVSIRITGVGIQCALHMTRPELLVNLDMVDSTIQFVMQVGKRVLPDGSEAPLGAIQMESCEANLEFRHHEIAGDMVSEAMTTWLRDVRNGLVSMLLCRVLTDTVDHWGRDAMSNFAGEAALVIRKESNPVAKAAPQPTAPLVDWGEYPPYLFVQALLDGRLGKIMQTETVQKILSFGGRRGVLQLGHAAGFKVGSVDTAGVVNTEVPDLKIYGSGPHLGVKAQMQSVRVTADVGLLLRPLSSWLHFGSQPVQQASLYEEQQTSNDRMLQDKITMALDLNDISLEMLVRSMVSQPALDRLEVDQLQSPTCLGHTATTAATPGNHSVSLRKFDLSVAPVAFQAGAPGTLEAELFSTLYTSFVALMRHSQPAMTSLVQDTMDLVIMNKLTEITECGTSGVYYGHPAFTSFCWHVSLALTAIGIALAAVTCLSRQSLRHVYKAQDLELDGYDCDESRTRARTMSSCSDSRVFMSDEDEPSWCLAVHPAVPPPLAVCYPFLVTATIFLFLYADFSLGTTLEVTFSAGDQSTTFGPIFTFSLLSIIRDTWLARAYLFSFLAGVMSGIWPIMKLVLLLVAWLTPSPVLSVQWRGNIVTFLDQYGKFSLVDIWLGIIGLASYNLHWEGEGAAIKVRPVVLDGFFMFVVGTGLSLVLGHVAAIYHQRTVPEEGNSRESSDGESEQIEAVDSSDDSARAMIGLNLFTMLVICLGAVVTSFHMIVSGVAADVLTDPPQRITTFSLWSLGEMVAAADRSSLALQLTPYFMYMHTLLIPLALCGTLIVLECVKYSMPSKRRLIHDILTLCRIMDAWSALDVFALAVFVSSLEIGLFARYLVYYDNISAGCLWLKNELDLDCMGCDCRLDPGFLFLMIAGLLSYSVPKYVFFTVGQKKRELDCKLPEVQNIHARGG